MRQVRRPHTTLVAQCLLLIALGAAACDPSSSRPAPALPEPAPAPNPTASSATTTPPPLASASVQAPSDAPKPAPSAAAAALPDEPSITFPGEGTVSSGASSADPDDHLDVSDIRSVLQAARPKFRRCFEEGLQRNAELHGRVTLRITIAASGRIAKAELLPTPDQPLNDAKLRACYLTTARALVFRKSKRETVVQFPLRFTAQ